MMGGEPGDRQLGLPGPLVGFMPQSIRLLGSFLPGVAGCLFTTSFLLGVADTVNNSEVEIGFSSDTEECLAGFIASDFLPLRSLAMEFTIKETFAYFGRLLNLKADLVASRQAELLQLLQLGDEESRQVKWDARYHDADDNGQVRHLSGGQQRRLSLALALLHKPRILVLDEPTVSIVICSLLFSIISIYSASWTLEY